MELEYELYFAALRHEGLRPLAAECLDEMARMLTRLVPEAATARAVVALIDGLTLQVLLADRPYDREGTRAALERLMGGDGDDGEPGAARRRRMASPPGSPAETGSPPGPASG